MQKTIFIIVFLLVLASTKSIAQKDSPQVLKNQLSIEIVDVVGQNHLSDLTLIIANDYDTLSVQVDSVYDLVFELDSSGSYSTTVIKAGYETLSIDWENPTDSVELVLEFYMPKTKLTKQEKRTAHDNSKNLPVRPCATCGGFQSITVSHKELCAIRFGVFNGDYRIHGLHVFRKLSDY